MDKIFVAFLFFALASTAQELTKKTQDGTSDKYEKMAELFSQSENEDKEVFFYRCKNIRGESLSKLLENFLTPGGTVASSEESEVVVIRDVKSNIASLKKIVAEVDIYIPKIVVEARIVEFTLDSDFEKEVEVAFNRLPIDSQGFVKELSSVLNTPGANPNPTQGNRIRVSPYERSSGDRIDTLNVFLRYLETKGKAKILNATNLTVMRGEDGSIITGEEVPILTQTVTSGSVSTSTEFKSVGTKLRVKPIMIVDDKVRLEINPEVSTVTSFTSAGDGVSNPVIAVRNAKTTFDIRHNQMLSIGGLMRNEKREVDRRVPYLSVIPIFGWFFRSKRIEDVQSQVVIFLNIKILEDDGKDYVTQPGAIPENIQKQIDKIKQSLPQKKESFEEDKKLILDQK